MGRQISGRAVLMTIVALSTVAIVGADAVGVAGASQPATFVDAGYKAGSASVDVLVDVPNSIDNEARNAGKDYALCVTLAYTSNDQTFETLRSGRVSISSIVTSVGAGSLQKQLQGMTREFMSLALGSTPPPGGSPGYNATAVILDPTELTCP